MDEQAVRDAEAGPAWVAFVRAMLAGDERVADGLAFACRAPKPLRFVPGYGGPAADVFIERFDESRARRQVAATAAVVDAYEANVRSVGPYLSYSLLRLVQAAAAVWEGHEGYPGAPS